MLSAASQLNSRRPFAAESRTDGASPAASQHRAELWVDRYRPQRFVELAGDERVNRETLAWVKEWDQCVFGSRRRKLKRKREEEPEQSGWTDQWGRPREKVLIEYKGKCTC